MGVMSTLNTLGSGASRSLRRPRGDVSHLGGATAQRSHTRLAKGDGQRVRPTAGSPPVRRLGGGVTVTRH